MNTLILMAKDVIALMIPVFAAFFAYFGYIFGGNIGAGLAGASGFFIGLVGYAVFQAAAAKQ
ncbi:hypothetical protein ACEK06_02765 [Pseudomonas brenneri]|uniref:Uncharacterized protein n=1 Tax=Pseudomonas lactis TaxID=1615674 RepID=A0ABS9FJZ0_9PSED|nr:MULTISPECIES: hypothetical protein [Pseudomonas]MCF4971572.1 hypothetical protein [Pseudomonas lactis]MCF5000695.1 hypothetical protein [Pseudomonas lactis]MCF5006813.1 hypothetical protein [Pseudomonas lactis]MCF5011496.1 hypothetical protein [Pseudomonas lactis]MCF5016558.1 hypothetical protein [Pseudomonas lactis]